MTMSRLIVAILGAALVVASCATSPTGRSQMIWKSDAELAVEASKQFAEMTASLPLVTDRPTIDYIACVANEVVSVLEYPYSEYEWEMRIFDNESVNAFAMPGGKIGIFVGIQVAAVLLGGGHSGATYTAYEALNQGAVLGIMLPFNRGQESEADIVGLEYMARAGFDPREAVPLWKNMSAQHGGNEPAEFMSTHPSSERRIEQLISEWPKVLPLYNEAVEEGRRANCTPPPSAEAAAKK